MAVRDQLFRQLGNNIPGGGSRLSGSVGRTDRIPCGSYVRAEEGHEMRLEKQARIISPRACGLRLGVWMLLGVQREAIGRS